LASKISGSFSARFFFLWVATKNSAKIRPYIVGVVLIKNSYGSINERYWEGKQKYLDRKLFSCISFWHKSELICQGKKLVYGSEKPNKTPKLGIIIFLQNFQNLIALFTKK
jgi:hypothetical protein